MDELLTRMSGIYSLAKAQAMVSIVPTTQAAGVGLMPINESPSYHGYDVVDYRAVERDYGDNATFKQLMDEARRLPT